MASPARRSVFNSGLISSYADSATVLLEALPKGRTIFRSCRDNELVIHLSTQEGKKLAR